MVDSPSTLNYRIPSGIGYFKLNGETAFRDLGMLEDFTISTTSSKLDHRDTRTPGGPIDFSKLTQTARTVKFTMVELTEENMSLFILGVITTNTAGDTIIDDFTDSDKSGYLRFESTNDSGPVWNWEGYVTINPTGDFVMLSNNAALSQIAVETNVNKDPATGRYGRWTRPAA